MNRQAGLGNGRKLAQLAFRGVVVANALETANSRVRCCGNLFVGVRFRGVNPEKRQEARRLAGVLEDMFHAAVPMLGTFGIGSE